MNQHAEYSSLSSIAFKTNLRLFCLIIVLSHTLFVSSPLLTVIAAAADVDDSSFSSSSTLLRHNNIDESTVGRDLGPILNDEKTVSVSSSYSMLTASWSTQRVRTLIASMFNDGKVTSTSINSLSSQPQHYDDNVDQKLITKQSVVQSSTHSLTSQSSSQPASNHQRNALAIEQASSSTNVENVETNNNSNDFVKRLNVKKTKSPTSTPTIRKPSRSPSVVTPTRNPRVRTPRPTDAPRTRKPTTKKPTSAPTKSPTKRKPNVVLIVADDIGYADVGFNKNPYVNTPYLNKLATESVRLNNFHMNPTCSPGRAGLFAGRYASRTGVWHTIMNRSILRSNETTLADVFKREGYNTALIGKWHLGDNYPYRPLDRGFDYWFGFYGGGLQQTPDKWGNTNNNPIFTRNQVDVVQTKGFCTDVLFDDAIAYLYKVKQPFLLVITPNAAHDPQTAPMEYKAQYKDQPYADFYGMINNLDVNIQKLDMALDSLGYKDYTIFIFTSDNGSACGSSRCTYNAGLSGDKSSVYDGGHRVPFIMRFPFDKSIIPHDVDELVAGIDILPMLIELTTLPVSTEYLTVSQFQESGTMYQYSKFKEENVGWEMMQLTKQVRFDGKSFVSLLRSVPDNGNFANRMVLVEDQREYTPVKWAATVIMMGDWRYIPPKLFDMKTDRAQTTNVAAKYPEIVQQMVDFYDNYWNEVSPSFNLVERISVGNPIANPVYLNSMDWNTKIQPPWSQEMVTSEEGARFGAWTLKVEEAGMYKIVARRWPFDLERAINFSDSFKFARLVLDGSTVQTLPVSGNKSSVEFKISLKQGPVDMMVVFYTSSSNSLGAYYTSVESL